MFVPIMFLLIIYELAIITIFIHRINYCDQDFVGGVLIHLIKIFFRSRLMRINVTKEHWLRLAREGESPRSRSRGRLRSALVHLAKEQQTMPKISELVELFDY